MEELPALQTMAWIATHKVRTHEAGHWEPVDLDARSLAFLQYTSGSTANPKAVMISHGNILHNEEMIRRAFDQSAESVVVGWLPFFHDMGLIGNLLQPIYVGSRCTLMAPMTFLRSPALWLRAISHYRGTTSGGPNFAFDLCVRKIDLNEILDLDLTCWKVAFNGAEPVRSETLERFAEKFAPIGFQRKAFSPCYGLAEATLLVAGGRHRACGTEQVIRVETRALEEGKVALIEEEDQHDKGVYLVSCGKPLFEQNLAIVEPGTGKRCRDGTVGQIWVRGPSVAQGYWNDSQETTRIFRRQLSDAFEPSSEFLDTGDLGFLRDGALFVTGRSKDLIILRGRNYYPQDIETAVEMAHPALRAAGGAAFSHDMDGEERLVIVHEVERTWRRRDLNPVVFAVRQTITEQFIQPYAVYLVGPRRVPKTINGKVRRNACRAALLAGDLRPYATYLYGAASNTAAAGKPAAEPKRPGEPIEEPSPAMILRDLAGFILGCSSSQIALDDPLSAHGLDSLSGMELRNAVEMKLDVSLSVASFLAAPSCNQLAEQILERRHNGVATGSSCYTKPVLLPGMARDQQPLSFGQERLWFLSQIEPDNPFYNISGVLRFLGPLQVPAVAASIDYLWRRHELFRSRYPSTDGRPYQEIVAPQAGVLHHVDLRTIPVSFRRPAASRLANRESQRPFDLSRGPLTRVYLLSLSDREAHLLLTLHHIVADGWSMGILVRELRRTYQALIGNRSLALPRLPVRYADYAHWQRQWLRGETLERELRYWRTRLANTDFSLDLPADRSRQVVRSYRGVRQSLEISADLWGSLHSLSRRRQVTVYSCLVAAFGVLIHRYTGQREFCLGSPVASRNLWEIKDLIGFFANTLVLKLYLGGQPSFIALLDRIGRGIQDDLSHQDLPFERLVEELQPKRELSRQPLFQVMLGLQSFRLPGERLGDLSLEPLELDAGVAHFDLSLFVEPQPSGARVVVRYDIELFDATRIDRLLSHFMALLEGIASHPGRVITQLPVLSRAEQQVLLREWQETQSCPREGTVLALFADQVRQRPRDAVALLVEHNGESQTLTYNELDQRSDRLARYLMDLGVGPGGLVGICLPRSSEWAVSILAILKAGGAWVPVDPAYTSDRSARLLEHSGAEWLITHQHLQEQMPEISARFIALDGESFRLPPEPAAALLSPACAEHAAYVVFTSGSTGEPKGVVVTHRNLRHYVEAINQRLGIGTHDVYLHTASFSFSSSVRQLFLALIHGATVVVATHRQIEDPVVLFDLIRRRGVTVIDLVPSYWRSCMQALMELEISERERLLDHALRLVTTASEPLLSDVPALWNRELGHDAQLVNMYGQTETTGIIATLPIDSRISARGGIVPVGRPIPRTLIRVLDRYLQQTPLGVPGETYIGGSSVAQAYLGSPATSAASFLPDPLSEVAGARIYRTGDLARHRPQGELEFLGRSDQQIKIRGFRIEPGEVESALVNHPAVREGIVNLQTTPDLEQHLVCYVVPSGARTPAASELRDFLARKLPSYMVPTAWSFLDELPRTSTGKINRKDLPEVAVTLPKPASAIPTHTTVIEEMLVGIWAKVLGLSRVGVEQSFFELGGHSLLATRLMSRVQQSFGVDFPLRTLFEEPTIAAMAAKIESLRAAEQRPLPPVEPVPRPLRLPLSFAQERLWMLDRLDPGKATYNLPYFARLSGSLRPAWLFAALDETVRRHESLRTSFPLRGEEPVQQITPAAPLSRTLVDLRRLPPAASEEEASRLAQAEAQRTFDLSRGPLLRTTLVELGKGEYLLLLSMHHIVSDAWSRGILVAELAALYGALTRDEPSPLPESELQYADYALWQRQWLQGQTLEPQLSYWRRQLSGAPSHLSLPPDRPRPAVQGFRGALCPVHFSHRLWESLVALGREQGVTLFMVLLAGFQAVFSRHAGSYDIVVGSPIAHRNRREIEGLIGFFVNTLVLRTDLSGNPSFRDVLTRTRATALGAYSHQDIPFEQLVEVLRVRSDLAHSPLFQVMLVLQNAPESTATLPGVDIQPLEMDCGASRFDLTLSLSETPAGLEGSWEYSVDLFDQTTVLRLSDHLGRLLSTATGACGLRLSELTLLSAAESHQLLVEWGTETPDSARRRFGRETTILRLVEEQARRSPDRLAALSGGEVLSFQELVRQAHWLARQLRIAGLEAEDPVGVYTERSPRLAVALLAVLKAGGALLPLALDTPYERLRGIALESGLRLILTEEHLLERLAELPGRRLLLDRQREVEWESTDSVPLPKILPDQLAYLFFTSGSTGRPKGVQVSHRALADHTEVMAALYSCKSHDRVLQFAAFSFDVALEEILPSWTVGAGVVFWPAAASASLSDFHRFLSSERVTILNVPTSYWRQWIHDAVHGLPGSLRQVIVGSEAMSANDLECWLELTQRRRIAWHNAYGVTEATITSLIYTLQDAVSQPIAVVPVGRPIPGAGAILLDATDHHPVPIGVAGHLHLAGERLARGYLRQPSLSAERFVPDRRNANAGGRLYKTGDLARHLPGGQIEFLGRIDRQLKVRGIRIELGEIEATLMEHPAVRRAAVVACSGSSGETRLAAYLEARSSPLRYEELRQHLLRHVPMAMVPASFSVLEKLPLLPSGKVDHIRLLYEEAQLLSGQREFEGPQTQLEEQLCGIWQEVLDCDRIGIHDDFFELGGHSLAVIRILARLQTDFEIELPMQVLFEGPTVADLAEHVEAALVASLEALTDDEALALLEEG